MRLTAWLCVLLLLNGCAAQNTKFISLPDGALIEAGEQSCTAPCVMNLGTDKVQIHATLPDGRSKTLTVTPDMIERADVQMESEHARAMVYTAVGYPLVAVGFVLALPYIFSDDSLNISTHQNSAWMGWGLVALLSGGYLVREAKSITANKPIVKYRVIEIDFAEQ